MQNLPLPRCIICLQDATWTLNVQKTGTDTVYQGAVNGQITITNPQNVPVTVYNINDYVQGGPQSTVSCGSPVPFQVGQYSSAMRMIAGPNTEQYDGRSACQDSTGRSSSR